MPETSQAEFLKRENLLSCVNLADPIEWKI